MKIKELTKEEFDKLPVYQGDYLYVSSISEEKVLYDGQTYLVMDTVATGRQLVTSSTVIAHMVSYYDISELGEPVGSNEWKVSNGHAVLIKDRARSSSQTLPAGTKYRVVRAAKQMGDWINPGTLAVRYPDVRYPSI